MALILTKDLDGKGNATMDGTKIPYEWHDRHGKKVWISTGGDALYLENAKADGLIFRPWEMVEAGGRANEEKILRYCQGNDIPITRMDWRNPAMVREYLERNPEKKPKSAPGTTDYLQEVAGLIAETMSPETVAPRVVGREQGGQKIGGGAAPKIPKADAPAARTISSSTDMGAQRSRGEQAAAEIDARHAEHDVAKAAYDEAYARNVEKHGATRADAYGRAAATKAEKRIERETAE